MGNFSYISYEFLRIILFFNYEFYELYELLRIEKNSYNS